MNNEKLHVGAGLVSAQGITLIALIITIIVMLILAGVVLNFSIGERGIFNTAKDADEKTKIAEYIEKVELSRGQVALDNLGQVTIDNLIEQIYKDNIVSRGSVTKQPDEKSAKMITKEGYIFIITADKIEYIGKGNEVVTTPEANLEAGNTTDGQVVLKIKAALPNDTIQTIEIYDESKTKIDTINIPTGIQQIEKEKTIYVPFYEEKSYTAKIVGTANTLDSNQITVQENTDSITSAKDLQKLASLINDGVTTFEGKTIKQIVNIDLSTVCSNSIGNWKPIGAGGTGKWFNGTYDGNKKEITNLYIDNNEEKTIGLFGFLGCKGTVKNVFLYGDVTQNVKDRAAGGIVGKNEGIIENCINNANVTNTANDNSCGGIAGTNFNSIQNCINNGTVTSNSGAGGIVGCSARSNTIAFASNNSQEIGDIIVSNCTNIGTIKGTNDVGGIYGDVYRGTVDLCTNEGNITASTSIVGGIAGVNHVNITNCRNKGNVTSEGNPSSQGTTQGTGGIAGRSIANISCSSNEGTIKSEGYFVGGILGYGSENTTIDQCYNKGSIEIKQNAAGGIVGSTVKEVSNCYNYLGTSKTIKATFNVGGIVGNGGSKNAVTIKNCYSIGENIVGSSNASIVGAWYFDGLQVDNCYYLDTSNLDGIGTERGGTLTTNNIYQKSLNDFELPSNDTKSVTYLLNKNNTTKIWEQNEDINGGYPYLIQNQPVYE